MPKYIRSMAASLWQRRLFGHHSCCSCCEQSGLQVLSSNIVLPVQRIQCSKGLWHFFLFAFPLCLILLWILEGEETYYREAGRAVSNQAERAASLYSRLLASRLTAHFEDLQTVAVTILGTDADPSVPTPAAVSAIRRFASLHSNIYPVNIQSADGQNILWSTSRRRSRPITAASQFTPLQGNGDFLLGQDGYSARAAGEVLSMRFRMRGKQGEALYYVGSHYRVSALLQTEQLAKPWEYYLVDSRDGSLVGRWRDGKVGFPRGTSLPRGLHVAVPGFPLTVVVDWPKGLARQAYLAAAPRRWALEAGGYLLIVLISSIVFFLLRQRDRNAARLERLAHFNAMLAQVNEVISSEQDEQRLLQATCDCAVQYGHLKVAYVARPDEQGDFRFLASAGATAYVNGLRLSSNPDVPEGQGHAGLAWRQGKSFYSEVFGNTAALRPWRERAQRFGLKSSAAVPIFRGNGVCAIFVALHSEESVFDADLRALVEELARNITRGLDRLDAAARERELSALQKTLLDNTFAGVLMVKEYRVVQANRKAADMLGYTNPEELIGQHPGGFFTGEDEFERFNLQYEKLGTHPSVSVAGVRLVSKGGNEIICDIAGGRTRHEDQDIVVLTLLDVTEHERAKEQLQLLNDRLTLATAAAGAGVWDYNPVNDRLVWGARLYEIYGIHPGDFSGNFAAWKRCVYPEDREKAQAEFQQALEGEGDFDAEFRIVKPDGEVRWLGGKAIVVRDTHGVARRVIGVNWDITERHEAEKRVQYQALHDPLTLLPNRWALDAALEQAIARARRADKMVAIGMLDLDDFKPINDRYGHDAGDRLLVELSRRLKANLREADFLARLGGDEFVVVLEEFDGQQPMRQLAAVLDRLHQAVESSFEISAGTHVGIGMSLGLALFPADAEDGDALLRMADVALYQIKTRKAGRERWWALAGAAELSAEPEIPLEPYSPAALALLQKNGPPWASPLAGDLVDVFYERLGDQAELQKILGNLSAEEIERLKIRQAEHMAFVLDPNTGQAAIAEKGYQVGQTHALCGISSALLVESFLIYRILVGDSLDQAKVSTRIRNQLQYVAEGRLQDDLRAQLNGAEEVNKVYLSYLARQLPNPGSLWADVASSELQALGQLPGILAAAIMRPGNDGLFLMENQAGPLAPAIHAITLTREIQPSIDERAPLGRSLVAQAWRSRQIMSSGSYLLDEQFTAWHAAFGPLGVRSGLAMPVVNLNGYPVVAVRLYGAYPGQFESSWMRQFARGLQQRWAELWQRCSASAPITVLPHGVCERYRTQLFNGGLVMHVQPVVDLKTGYVSKVEALARLQLDDGHVVSPGFFLPLLGNQELDELFRIGLDKTLAQLKRWDALGWSIGASVNLSPTTLMDPDCVHWVKSALTHHEIGPGRLSLEILETQDLQGAEQQIAMERLAALGVNLAMDDLGSGYSSLLRLSGLPFHTIKTDQQLVARLRSEPLKTMGLIAALIQVGRDFDLEVVVEGLENAEMVEAVAMLGATKGQGFGLGRPMSPQSFFEWQQRFDLPMVPGAINTWLGALAYHWKQLHSGNGGHPTDLEHCPLTRFLIDRGLQDSDLAHWHARVHNDASRDAVGRRLLEGLVALLRNADRQAAIS